MNALATDIRDLIAERLGKASLREIVDLVEQPRPAPVRRPAFTSVDRYTRLGSDGRPTMDAQDQWVAVHDSKTGLTWMAEPVASGNSMPWTVALEAAAAIRLFDKTDWRAPTIEELLSIVDYTRSDPAVNTEYFKGPFDWTWSSTPAVAPSGGAWDVFLNDGDSNRLNQTYDFRVRAVRAGQSLELGL